MAKIAGIELVSINYTPVAKTKKYMVPHPETAAKHIVWGWGKLSDSNSPEMIKLIDEAKKGVKKLEK